MRGLASSSFDALGSLVTVHVTDTSALDVATEAVKDVVAKIDSACSRFRADSDLSSVNDASGRWVRVSPLFIDALTVAIRAARLTDGDLDPTVGRAVILAGYDRTFEDIASIEAGWVSAGHVPGWQSVAVDRGRQRVAVARDCALDLGATAKAFGADRAATRAASRFRDEVGVAVTLGGDVSIAGPPPEGGWRIGVADHHAGPESETIASWSGGVATSTTSVRSWVRGGRTMHHLIDPSTGEPAEEVWRTATVAAASCVDANIASSTAIIRGERAPAWLEGLGLPARLVRRNGSVVTTEPWPSAS